MGIWLFRTIHFFNEKRFEIPKSIFFFRFKIILKAYLNDFRGQKRNRFFVRIVYEYNSVKKMEKRFYFLSEYFQRNRKKNHFNNRRKELFQSFILFVSCFKMILKSFFHHFEGKENSCLFFLFHDEIKKPQKPNDHILAFSSPLRNDGKNTKKFTNSQNHLGHTKIYVPKIIKMLKKKFKDFQRKVSGGEQKKQICQMPIYAHLAI